MYKWTFFFETEKLESKINTDRQDNLIKNAVESNKQGFISIPGDKFDLYVNLTSVKCISREIVADEPEAQAPTETN